MSSPADVLPPYAVAEERESLLRQVRATEMTQVLSSENLRSLRVTAARESVTKDMCELDAVAGSVTALDCLVVDARVLRFPRQQTAFLRAAAAAPVSIHSLSWYIASGRGKHLLPLASALQDPAGLRELTVRLSSNADPSTMLQDLWPKLRNLESFRLFIDEHYLCISDIMFHLWMMTRTSLFPTLSSLEIVFDGEYSYDALSDNLGAVVTSLSSSLRHLRISGNLPTFEAFIGEDSYLESFSWRHSMTARMNSSSGLQLNLVLKQHCQSLRYLDLTNLTNLGNHHRHSLYQADYNAIAEMKQLRVLNVAYCLIKDDGMKLLANALLGKQLLQHLDVRGNWEGLPGVHAMTAVFPKLQRLQCLRITEEWMDSQAGVEEAWLAGIAKLPCLATAPMPASCPGVRQFVSLPDALFWPHLTTLSLPLAFGRSARRRYMRQDDVSEAEHARIVTQALTAKLPLMTALTSLSLGNECARIPADVPILSALAAVMLRNKPVLQSLSLTLDENAPVAADLGDVIVNVLAESLEADECAPALRSITLSGIKTSSDVLDRLFRQLHRRRSVFKRFELRNLCTQRPPMVLPSIVLEDVGFRSLFYVYSGSMDRDLIQVAAGAVPPISPPSLFELTASIAIASQIDDPVVPQELQRSVLLHRLRPCLLCNRATAATRSIAFARRARACDQACLIQCHMCCLCYHLTWMQRDDADGHTLF